jgi:hypothetical protein
MRVDDGTDCGRCDNQRPVKPHRISFLLCVSLLSGCVTVAELHQSQPVRTGTVAGSYLSLARCVRENLARGQATDGTTYDFQDFATAKTANILAIARAPAGLFYTVPAPLLELSLHQADERTVKIEARRSRLGTALEPTVWTILEQCAGRTVTVSPPVS